MFRKSNKMHFIGIGGIGMSGIAEILINLGYDVSGSDLNESDQTKRLKTLGAEVFIGHVPSNVRDYNVVVTSTAIPTNNPELIEARNRKIPIIHRSEMLAELVRLKYGIGVAGTHGKTTVSSMLAYVCYHCGINPTAVIGGKVLNFGSNARVGQGEYMVFEADESDGTFLKLLPSIAVVTNIDADHLDYYKYFQGLKDAFLEYINNIPFYGYSVLCIDDITVREILPKIERPYFTYGLSEDADFRAYDIRYTNGKTFFKVSYRDEYIGEFDIWQLGNHNVLNSLSVVAVALELGLEYKNIREGLSQFKGVGRRLERIGESRGILVLDDYGHHPTEIKATLEAVKIMGRRVIAIFQPHRYTRTQLLWDEFGQSFNHADDIYLTEIYPAGESPIEGVNSQLIVEAIKKHEDRDAKVISKYEDIPEVIASIAKEGDVILTLGAGDIYKMGSKIIDRISKIES